MEYKIKDFVLIVLIKFSDSCFETGYCNKISKCIVNVCQQYVMQNKYIYNSKCIQCTYKVHRIWADKAIRRRGGGCWLRTLLTLRRASYICGKTVKALFVHRIAVCLLRMFRELIQIFFPFLSVQFF